MTIKEILSAQESYLTDIRPFLAINWITGFFPGCYDKNLNSVKFSWISLTTVSSCIRILILISGYLFCYMRLTKQELMEDASASVIHAFMMHYEFVFASVSDLLLFVFFPSMSENVTKLVTITKHLKGRVHPSYIALPLSLLAQML